MADSQAISTATTPASPRWPVYVVSLGMVVFAGCFSVVSLYRHAGLNSTGFDLAIKHQVLWNTARGRPFASSFEVSNYLGDHVQPIMLLLSPLTWLPNAGVEVLLVFQVVMVASAAWPAFLLARRRLSTPTWWAVLPLALLLHPSIGFMCRYDVHFVTLAIPGLLWLILCIQRNQLRAATMLVVLLLACREEVGLAVAGVAVWAAFGRPTRRWGMVIAPVALAWSVFAVTVIIPYYRGAAADTLDRYAWLGETPFEVVTTLLTTPLQVGAQILRDPIRLNTLAYLLWPWMLLPLLAPARLATAILPLLVCLLPDQPSQNSIYFHYLAPVLPLVWWAALGGAERLEKWLGYRRSLPDTPDNAHAEANPGKRSRVMYAGAVAVLMVSATSFAVQNPVTRPVTEPFWPVHVGPPRPNTTAFHAAATRIGEKDGVLTTMAFAPHLSARQGLAIIDRPTVLENVDVILVDVTDFRWVSDDQRYARFLRTLITQPDFGIIFWQDDIVMLRASAETEYDPADVLPRLPGFNN